MLTMAVSPGFEPELSGPKPDVLPLHHETTQNGSGGWSRTTNAQVMGLLSYRCSTPHRKVAVCVDARNISYTKRTHWPMFPS